MRASRSVGVSSCLRAPPGARSSSRLVVVRPALSFHRLDGAWRRPDRRGVSHCRRRRRRPPAERRRYSPRPPSFARRRLRAPLSSSLSPPPPRDAHRKDGRHRGADRLTARNRRRGARRRPFCARSAQTGTIAKAARRDSGRESRMSGKKSKNALTACCGSGLRRQDRGLHVRGWHGVLLHRSSGKAVQ
jgi:hypothetical protein